MNDKYMNDAYLYCNGDLSHSRLLLGMEYFNYKKWPKQDKDDKDCLLYTSDAADD